MQQILLLMMKQVMTLVTYEDKTFCSLCISKGSEIDECSPWSTHSFIASDTFASVPPFSTLSQSFNQIHSLSVTESVSFSASSASLTVSLTETGSTLSYILSNFIFYSYTVVQYSSYFAFYSDFFTVIFLSEEPKGNRSLKYISQPKTTVDFLI